MPPGSGTSSCGRWGGIEAGGSVKKQPKREAQQAIKLNTALTIALVCLIAGFLGGVVYTTYKTGTGGQPRRAPQAGPSDRTPSPTPQQSQRILELEQQVSQSPDNQEAWAELGHLYFDSGNTQGAIRSYLKYLDLNPRNPDIWTDLGVMYRRSGKAEEAVSSFERAMALDPRHQQSRFNKGIVLMQDLNQAEEAVAVWRELLGINPEFRLPGGRRLSEVLAERR